VRRAAASTSRVLADNDATWLARANNDARAHAYHNNVARNERWRGGIRQTTDGMLLAAFVRKHRIVW